MAVKKKTSAAGKTALTNEKTIKPRKLKEGEMLKEAPLPEGMTATVIPDGGKLVAMGERKPSDDVPIIEGGDNHMHDEDMPQNKKPIVPIFIGCGNPRMIELIVQYAQGITDKTITGDGNDYDIVIMGQEVLEGAVQTYFFNRLNKDNQDNLLRQQEDKRLRAQALKKSLEFDDMMRGFLNIKGVGTKYTFTVSQLKLGVDLALRKTLTNKELREVVDFLSIYGYITPTLLNVPYIKQKFEFTIDDHAMLLNTEMLQKQAVDQINQLQNQLEMLEINKKILENKIANPTALTDGEEVIAKELGHQIITGKAEMTEHTEKPSTDGEDNHGHIQSGTAELPNT